MYREKMEEAVKYNKKLTTIMGILGFVTLPIGIGLFILAAVVGSMPGLTKLQKELRDGPHWYR